MAAEEFLPLEEGSNDRTNGEPKLDRKRIKHLLVGDPALVRSTIRSLHILGYSEVREWSKPVSAGSLGYQGEVVSVLLRYIQ